MPLWIRPPALGVLNLLLLLCRPLAAEPGAWLGAWETLGPDGAQVSRIVPHPTDPDSLWARTSLAVLRSRDGGSSWQDVSPGFALDPHGTLAVDPRDPDHLYTGGAPPFTLLESRDGGATWAAAGAGLPCCRPCCTTIESLVIDPSNPAVLYAGISNTPVFKSTDGGTSFTVAGRGQPQQGTGVIALDPTDVEVLYTAGFTHVPGFGGINTFHLVTSADAGASWRPLGSISVFASEWLLGLAVDPGNPDLLYAATTGGVRSSRDRGGSWSFMGSPPGGLSAFALDPGGDGLLYGGNADGRLFLSPNEGESWLPLGTGQPASQVLTLAPVPAAPLESFTPALYAGTFAAGAYVLRPDRAAPCLPDETTLCLLGGRFRAELLWVRPRGRQGAGRADPLGDRAGTFTFFEPGRPDLFTKLLDGRRVNGHFWVFFGGLTHVEHHLFVSDSGSGRLRAYAHRGRGFASGGDVRAFRGAEPAGSTALAATGFEARAAAGARALSFVGGRFQVDLAWQTPGGRVRSARGAVLPGGEAGSFWFSAPDNPELVVKLVDARALVDAFWLFHAGLSNLAYTLTVTDTLHGTTRAFDHPAGGFASGTLTLPD